MRCYLESYLLIQRQPHSQIPNDYVKEYFTQCNNFTGLPLKLDCLFLKVLLLSSLDQANFSSIVGDYIT